MEDICTCKRCPCCGKLVQPLLPMPYTPPAPAPLPWDTTPYAPYQPIQPIDPFIPSPIWVVDWTSLPTVTC